MRLPLLSDWLGASATQNLVEMRGQDVSVPAKEAKEAKLLCQGTRVRGSCL